MANGKDHLIVNSLIGITYVTSFNNETNSSNFLYVCIGLFIGTLITPDYDLEIIVTKEMIKKVPIIGKLWNAYWLPYAKNFTHRGISHDPIIGTLTRFLYGFWWIFFFDNIQTDILFYILTGWYIQDFSHYIMDMPFYKKKDKIVEGLKAVYSRFKPF